MQDGALGLLAEKVQLVAIHGAQALLVAHVWSEANLKGLLRT